MRRAKHGVPPKGPPEAAAALFCGFCEACAGVFFALCNQAVVRPARGGGRASCILADTCVRPTPTDYAVVLRSLRGGTWRSSGIQFSCQGGWMPGLGAVSCGAAEWSTAAPELERGWEGSAPAATTAGGAPGRGA